LSLFAGNGVVIHVPQLFQELKELEAQGKYFFISKMIFSKLEI
jgi:adenylosuccinate synthase